MLEINLEPGIRIDASGRPYGVTTSGKIIRSVGHSGDDSEEKEEMTEEVISSEPTPERPYQIINGVKYATGITYRRSGPRPLYDPRIEKTLKEQNSPGAWTGKNKPRV